MSIQPIQIIEILILLTLGFGIIKVKNWKIKTALIIVAILIVFFQPVVFKQSNMSKIERRFNSTPELKEKINVTKNFKKEQEEEFKKLTEKSKEIQNEIH